MTDDDAGALARARAAEIVASVLYDARNLDAAFTAANLQALSERDRAFVKSLAFTTLRTHLRNLYFLEQLLDKPLRAKDAVIETLLSVALGALHESTTPDYATVSATVDATKVLKRPHLKGLVNAVLRRFLRERDALTNRGDMPSSARWAHPEWLVDALHADWPDDWEALLDAGNVRAPLWLRINTQQIERETWLADFSKQHDVAAHASDWLPTAVQLSEPLAVDELPGFREGACSVQDAASQFAATLLDVNANTRVLDACAAPGGKTGHLLEAGAGEVVALDSSAERLERVHENLARLRLAADVRTGDACAPDDWWDGVAFDRILIDAPCSATGVIRRHPDIRFLRRADDIPQLAKQQRAMLKALWPLLKPGGKLLYSTCSLLRAENENVVGVFLAEHADAGELSVRDMLPDELALTCNHGVQLLPGRGDTDGFYYALMERMA